MIIYLKGRRWDKKGLRRARDRHRGLPSAGSNSPNGGGLTPGASWGSLGWVQWPHGFHRCISRELSHKCSSCDQCPRGCQHHRWWLYTLYRSTGPRSILLTRNVTVN